MTARPLPHVFPTVVHMLADVAARTPDAVALSCAGVDLSYAEYVRCVGGLAAELADIGAGGGRVALAMGNSIDMVVAMFAAHAAGAQAVPINPVYTAREVGYILKDSDPVCVIFDASAAQAVEPETARLAIPHVLRMGAGGRDFTQWRGDADAALPLPDPDALATLQYTGGTTGNPKGVDITHLQMSVNVSQREALLPTRPDEETVVCAMPLFHVFAVSMCLHLTAYCRGRLVILPRYRPDVLLATLQNERVTLLPAGPTIFNGLLAHENFPATDLSALHACYSGSAPLPEETLRKWQAATGCFILEGYGQTEAGPVLTYNPMRGTQKIGSVGIPVPETQVEIVDVDTGASVLPAGRIGEIRARGPQIMSGYRNLPEVTAETLRDGWLHTGDIGELDDDGYLFIRDRKKDMAIVGGYNVYPREIDEVLYMHPSVLEAAAVGIPDEYYGEVVEAWVALKAGAVATDDDLLAHCRANLARYKVPRAIHLVDSVPKTTVGKIDKKALRRAPT